MKIALLEEQGDYAEIISKSVGETNEVTVIRDEDDTNLYRITFEKTLDVFVLNISNGEINYVGKINKNSSDVELATGDIKFTYNPSSWTKENVDVSIAITKSINNANYTLQYSEDGSKWNIYKEAITVTQNNKSIYARIKENLTGKIVASAVGNVDKIDRVKPEVGEITTTTNSITFSATDEESGIIGYAITEDTTEPTDFESCTNTKTLNVISKEKKQGKTYYIWVKDEAGNISDYKSTGTGTIANLTNANTTFVYNPSDWTNKKVKVTATTTEKTTGYTLRITEENPTTASKNTAINWKLASEGIDISTNNTTVYAVLVDEEGQVGSAAAGNVDKIDTTKPTDIVISTENTTTSSISIKVSAKDIAGANENASGISEYRYSSDNGSIWSDYQQSNEYTFNDLVGGIGKTYNIKVEVKDRAGNTGSQTQNISIAVNSDYVIDAANTQIIKYNWDQAGTGGYRTFTKAVAGKALGGICYVEDYIGPVLVSTDSAAVGYYTSDSGNYLFEKGGSFSWGGQTYYYSSYGYWFYKNCPVNSNLPNINQEHQNFSSMEIAAREILNRYYSNAGISYEMCFNGNGGPEISEKQLFNKDSSVTIRNIESERKGYHLLGWSTEYNATTATYEIGKTYSSLNKNLTLYAVWQKHDFSDESGICSVCKLNCNYLTASSGGENWNSGQILNYAT